MVTLGQAAESPEANQALAQALKDEDDSVRLMAAIGLLGSGAGPLAPVPRNDPGTTPALSPNPTASPAEALNLQEQLVYLDPWLAGALLPGILTAARDRDERVRGLALRALAVIGKRDQIDFRTTIRDATKAPPSDK